MSATDVALVTGARWPEGDPHDAPLPAALLAAGLAHRVVVWDDPAVDWSAFGLALIRSTWDYHLRREPFLAWAGHAAARTRLWNPPDLLRWSTHKAYLLDLERAGVPVVPTVLRAAGVPLDLAALLAERGWATAVVKPAVSLGGIGAMRVTAAEASAGQSHLDGPLAGRDALIQPYLESVEGPGERDLVFLDGRYSHAVRRDSAFAPGYRPGQARALEPSADERALAERALAAIPAPHLYARVDMARDAGGTPRIMELELVEPSLFLEQAPAAAGVLARAIARLLEQ